MVHASAASAGARGLDWFTFFLADIQTGFGPFVALYLTAHAWAQFDIGLVLTAGGVVALIGQMPGGALVDAVRSARLVVIWRSLQRSVTCNGPLARTDQSNSLLV